MLHCINLNLQNVDMNSQFVDLSHHGLVNRRIMFHNTVNWSSPMKVDLLTQRTVLQRVVWCGLVMQCKIKDLFVIQYYEDKMC